MRQPPVVGVTLPGMLTIARVHDAVRFNRPIRLAILGWAVTSGVILGLTR